MKQLKWIGRGRSADIFDYEDGRVLKLYREGFPEDAVREEFSASLAVYALGIPTPKPYELLVYEKRLGIVYQRIEGKSLLNRMSQKPWLLGSCARIMADLHHEMHDRPAGREMRSQKEALRRNVQAAPLLTDEEKAQILLYLDGLPSGDRLCHGDFHPGNVLSGGGHWVIDWMTGGAGHPAGDVARTLLLLRFGTMPDGAPKAVNAIINFMRNRISAKYLKRYLSISRLSMNEIEDWVLPVASARLVEWLPASEKEALAALVRERLAYADASFS